MTSSQVQASAADAVGRHEPVLLERCLDLLAPAIEGAAGSAAAPDSAQPVMIDCTLGAGGHAEGALRRFPALSVVGIARDPEAIALAGERLAPFGRRFRPGCPCGGWSKMLSAIPGANQSVGSAHWRVSVAIRRARLRGRSVRSAFGRGCEQGRWGAI